MNIAQNPNSELSHFAAQYASGCFEIPRHSGRRQGVSGSDDAVQRAIREFKTKLEVLNE